MLVNATKKYTLTIQLCLLTDSDIGKLGSFIEPEQSETDRSVSVYYIAINSMKTLNVKRLRKNIQTLAV